MRARGVPAWMGLAAAVAAVSWAAILVRMCEAPALGIAFYRLLLSALVLLPWALRPRAPATLRTHLMAVAAGVFLGLHFATWISSLFFTTVASSLVLVALQPVFTAVLGPFFLGERPGLRGWAAVGLAVGGTAILAGGDLRLGGGALLGDGLALVGALTASAYLMIGRAVRAKIGFARYLLVVYGTAAAVAAILALSLGAPLAGYPAATWVWIALLAAGPNLIGHGLLNWSVRRLRAFAVNVAILGEPVLGTAYAAWLFHEFPGRAFYAGALLIVAGIALALTRGEREIAAPAGGL